CAIPGYAGDTYKIQNETHALLVNQSIPSTNGQWDQCHVYRNVTQERNVSRTAYNVFNSSQSLSALQDFDREASECGRWVFDHSLFESTISDDFDIVCDRSWYRATSNMISELGTSAGCFVTGILSDRFGRKIAFYIGGFALIGGGFGIAFTQNIYTLSLCRFIMGAARIAVFVNGLV
ncbi:hypothetical protein BaRGS_00011390, partial [Batillaria attramentaria]